MGFSTITGTDKILISNMTIQYNTHKYITHTSINPIQKHYLIINLNAKLLQKLMLLTIID